MTPFPQAIICIHWRRSPSALNFRPSGVHRVRILNMQVGASGCGGRVVVRVYGDVDLHVSKAREAVLVGVLRDGEAEGAVVGEPAGEVGG